MSIEVIRADLARADHAAALLELLDAYVREPHISGRPLPDATRAELVPRLRAHPTSHVLLACADGAAVGVAVCFLGFSTFAARPLINVHDLAVLAEHRGRGIGGQLLAAAEVLAAELGCSKLTLEVQESNATARALYERFGFGHFQPGDTPVATLFLEKKLAG